MLLLVIDSTACMAACPISDDDAPLARALTQGQQQRYSVLATGTVCCAAAFADLVQEGPGGQVWEALGGDEHTGQHLPQPVLSQALEDGILLHHQDLQSTADTTTKHVASLAALACPWLACH